MLNKPFFGALIAALCLYSCGTHLNRQQLDAINKALEQSDTVIEEYNKGLTGLLKRMEVDPFSGRKALRWAPTYERAQLLTNRMDTQLTGLRLALNENKKVDARMQATLADSLINYRRALVAAFDTLLLDESRSTNEDFAQVRNRLPVGKEDIDGLPVTIELLNKLRIDCHLTEQMLLKYCTMELHGSGDDYYFRPAPIVGIKSSYVKAGDPVEIFAGVGVFCVAARPKISIGGKRLKLNDETGTASDTLIAATQPGKHIIPIQIEYYKPDGSSVTDYKNISYTVVRGQ